jgi:hypothetical protein
MDGPKTYSCRYEALLFILAIIDDRPLPEALPKCRQPATVATHMDHGGDGKHGVVYARQCDDHDRQYWKAPGYKQSVRLALPKSSKP